MKIATLGPTGTCSEFAVAGNLGRFGEGAVLVLYDTYEHAVDAVCAGEADAVAIAAAYPLLHEIVMQFPPRVSIAEAFVAQTPVLVMARSKPLPPGSSKPVVACVAATRPLLRSRTDIGEVKAALSNSDAANAVLSGAAEAALTTQPAAEAAGLEIYHSFGSLSMGWVVLKAGNGCEGRSGG